MSRRCISVHISAVQVPGCLGGIPVDGRGGCMDGRAEGAEEGVEEERQGGTRSESRLKFGLASRQSGNSDEVKTADSVSGLISLPSSRVL